MLSALGDLYHFQFMQNALFTGISVAVAASVSGYFLVMRGLTFAGHALPNIGFAGAAGAVLAGVKPVYGLFAFTIAAAVGIDLGARDARERDKTTGVAMTFGLGLGLMFLSLYPGFAERVYSILFGTILGISRNDAILSAVASLGVVGIIAAGFRPLVFVTFDPEAAEARGVPVRLISICFLVAVAVTVSLSVQVVGALLVFTLLVGPAATAARLASRPAVAVVIALVLGVLYVAIGVTLAGLSQSWPVSFFVAVISFLVYLPARIGRRSRRTQGTVRQGDR